MSGADISRAAVVGNMEEDDDRPPEENAHVIYDSDEEPDDFAQVPVESPFLVQLVARAKKIIEYDLLTSNIVFPYEDFEGLYQDLRTYLPQIHERLTRDAVWQSVVNWLVIIKQSIVEHIGSQKDERFHLILVNFVASYIHYKCMTYAERNRRPDADKVTSEIYTALDSLYRVPDEMNYILMALLKVNLRNYIFNAHYASVINPVFKKFLSNRKLHQNTDLISYVRLVLCYKKWKKLAHSKEEKEAINNYAMGNNFESDAEDPGGVLPQKIPKLKDNIQFARIFPKFSLAKQIERTDGKNFGSRVLLRDDSTDLDRMIRQFFKHYRKLFIENLPREESSQQPSLLAASDPGNLVRSSVQSSTIDKHLSNTCDIVNKEPCDVNSIEIFSISDDEIEEQRTSFKSMSIGAKQGSEISQKYNSKAPSNISNCRIVDNIVLSDDEGETNESQPCPSQTLPQMPNSNLQIENSSSSRAGMDVNVQSLHKNVPSEINEVSRDDRLSSIVNSSSAVSEETDLNSDLVNSVDKLLRTEANIDQHVELSCVELIGNNQIEVRHTPSVEVDGESISKNLLQLSISKSNAETSETRNEKSTNFEKTEHDKCNKNSFGMGRIPLKNKNSVLRESSPQKLIPVSGSPAENVCILVDELNNEHISETRSNLDNQCAKDCLQTELTAPVSGSNVLDNEKLLVLQEKEERTKTNVSDVIKEQMDKDLKNLTVNFNKATLETEEKAKMTISSVPETISQQIDEVQPLEVNLEERPLKSGEKTMKAKNRALDVEMQKVNEEVSLTSAEEMERIKNSSMEIVALKLDEEFINDERSLKPKKEEETIKQSSPEIVAQKVDAEVKNHEGSSKAEKEEEMAKNSSTEIVTQKLVEEFKANEESLKSVEEIEATKNEMSETLNEVNLKSAKIAVKIQILEPPINDLGVSDRHLALTENREQCFPCTNSEEAHNKPVVQHKSKSSSEEAVINDLFKFNSHNVETVQISPKKVETVTDTYNFNKTDVKTPIKLRFKRKFSQECKFDETTGNQSSLVLSTSCTLAKNSDLNQDDNDISALLERIDEALNDKDIPVDRRVERDNGESHSQKPNSQAKLKKRIQSRLASMQESKDNYCIMSRIEATSNDDKEQQIIESSTRLKNSSEIDLKVNDLSNKIKVVNNCKLNDKCLRPLECKITGLGSNQQPETKTEHGKDPKFTKEATKCALFPPISNSTNSTIVASFQSGSTLVNNRTKPIQRKPTININTAETRTYQNTNLPASENKLTIENRIANNIDGITSRAIPEQKSKTKVNDNWRSETECGYNINKKEERNVLLQEAITPGKPCPLKKRAFVQELIPEESPSAKPKEDSTSKSLTVEMGKTNENSLQKNLCSQKDISAEQETTATPKSVKQILMRRSSEINRVALIENATATKTLAEETRNQIEEVEKKEEITEQVEPTEVILANNSKPNTVAVNNDTSTGKESLMEIDFSEEIKLLSTAVTRTQNQDPDQASIKAVIKSVNVDTENKKTCTAESNAKEIEEKVKPLAKGITKLKSCLISTPSLNQNKRKITFSEENIQQTKKNVIFEENRNTPREKLKIGKVKEKVALGSATQFKTVKSKAVFKGIAKDNKIKKEQVLLSKIIPEKEKIVQVKVLEKSNLVIENSCVLEKDVAMQNNSFPEKLETFESIEIKKSPKKSEDKDSKEASIQSPNKDNDKNLSLSHSIDKILGECTTESSSSEAECPKGDVSIEPISTTKQPNFKRTKDLFFKSETKVLLRRVPVRTNELNGQLEVIWGKNTKSQFQRTENCEKLKNSFPEPAKLTKGLESAVETKNNVEQIQTLKTEKKVNNIHSRLREAQHLELNLVNSDTKPKMSLLQENVNEKINSDNREQQKWMKNLGLCKIEGQTLTMETNVVVNTNPPGTLDNLNLLAAAAGLQKHTKPKPKKKAMQKKIGPDRKRSTRNSCTESDKEQVEFFNRLAKQTYTKGPSKDEGIKLGFLNSIFISPPSVGRLGEDDDSDIKCNVKKRRKSNAEISSSKQFTQQNSKKSQQRQANNKRANNIEKAQVTNAKALIVNDDKITLVKQAEISENCCPPPNILENSIIQIKTTSEPIKPIPEAAEPAKPHSSNKIDLELKKNELPPLIGKQTASKNTSETNACLPESLMNHSVKKEPSSDEAIRNNQIAEDALQTDKPQNSKTPHSNQEKNCVQKKPINRNRMTLDDVCRTLWEQRGNATDAFALEKHEEKKEPETCKTRSTTEQFSKENENPNFDKCDEKESSEANKAEAPGHVSKLKTQPRRICKNLKPDAEPASQKMEIEEKGGDTSSTALESKLIKCENVNSKSSIEETPEVTRVYKVIPTVNNQTIPIDLSVHKTIDVKTEVIPYFENTLGRENGEIYESPKILTDFEIGFNSEEIIETTNTTDKCFKPENTTVELNLTNAEPNADCAVAANRLKAENLEIPDVLPVASEVYMKSDLKVKNANIICKEDSRSNVEELSKLKINNICEVKTKRVKDLSVDGQIVSKPASKPSNKSSSLNTNNTPEVNMRCNKAAKVVKKRATSKKSLTKLALEEILDITPSLPEEIFDVQDNEENLDDDNSMDYCAILSSGSKRSLSEHVPTDHFNPPLKKQKLESEVFELENAGDDAMDLLNEPIETLDHINGKTFSMKCDENSTSLDNLDNSEDPNPELSIFSPDEMFDYYMNSLTENFPSVLNDDADGMSIDCMISARNYGKNAGSSGSTYIKNSLQPSVTFEPEVEHGTPPIMPIASTIFKESSPDDGIGSLLDPSEFLPNDDLILEKLYDAIVKVSDKKEEVISFDEYDYASEIIIENGKSPKKDGSTTDGMSSVEVSPVLDEQSTSNTSPLTTSQRFPNNDSAHVTPTPTLTELESIQPIVAKAREVLARKNPIHDISPMNSFQSRPLSNSYLHPVLKSEVNFPNSVQMNVKFEKEEHGIAKRQKQAVVHKHHNPFSHQNVLFDEVRRAPPPATVRPVNKHYIKAGTKIKSYEQTEINNRTNQGKVQKVYLAPNPSRARVTSKKMGEAIIFISAAASNTSAVPLTAPLTGPSWGPQDMKSTEEILQDLRKTNGKVT